MYFFFSWANGCFWNCECDCFVLGGVIKVGFVLSENAVWSLIWLILHSMNMLFLFQLMSCVFKHTNPADPSQHTQHRQQQDLNPAKNSNPNTQTTMKPIPKSPKKKKTKQSMLKFVSSCRNCKWGICWVLRRWTQIQAAK